MKKILLLAALLFVASCVGPGNNSGDWNTGTQGVVMSFEENHPPSVVRGDRLNVVVEYANKGTYDVNDLRFYLHGYDPSIVFGQPVMVFTSPPLGGKDQFNPEGSQPVFAEWDSNINSPPGETAYPQKISVTSCYSYKTVAQPSLCVNPNEEEYRTVSEDGCKTGVEQLTSSQGGPVAVTGVNAAIIDNVINLEITVQNKGSGVPYVGSTLDNCYKLDVNNRNTITARVSMSDGEFTCEPQATYGKVRLDTGKIYCRKPNTRPSYYYTPLTIELMYNYAHTISKDIQIER